MMLMKLTLSHLVRNFKFTTPFKKVEDIKLKQDIILVPIDGYLVQLEARD